MDPDVPRIYAAGANLAAHEPGFKLSDDSEGACQWGMRSPAALARLGPGRLRAKWRGLVAFRVMFSCQCALDSLKLWSLGADVLPKTADSEELGSDVYETSRTS